MEVAYSNAMLGLNANLHYLSKENVDAVVRAFKFANKAPRGQFRVTGEPYIIHPVAVAKILASLKQDAVAIMAGLLHDVVEDTEVTQQDIHQTFGQEVAHIVEGVTKFSQVQYSSPLKRESENYRKMFISMSKDIRVIIVKLADRLHNMRTIQVMPENKRKRLAHETLDIYAPIAKRLGMQMVSIELEELGFAALYPLRYMILLSHMYNVSAGQAEVLLHLEKQIRLRAHEVGLEVLDVSTREKQLYGIYRKMSKRKSFNDLLDVYALRVCVKDIESCYAMIGILHGMYMPKPKSFKDYVAAPKRNGYQSLHTVLYGPHGTPIEIQVRTKEMHVMATQGVASHWLYKTGQSEFNCKKHQAWFNQLADAKSTCASDAMFIDLVKHTVFESELYVLTPRGKIIELKDGATVLDFAYCIHTDIGHKAQAAIVDRETVSINTVLENGQTVEIVTCDSVTPQSQWLDFVKTSRAKASIKVFLKEQVISSQDQLG
ncbi:RelA/SpoT family protein, partial [Gammaproteobacteria bacterium]|nr:RelA/SpoT family protein [Gammaproteobacteria bacterium]